MDFEHSVKLSDDLNTAGVWAWFVNADDDDDAAVNLKDKKDCNDDDTKRVPNLDWTIEGLDGLDEKHIRHSNAFYSLLKKWYAGKEYTSVLMTKASYDKIVQFLIYMRDGGDCRESYLSGNTNAYKWYRKFHVFTVGGRCVKSLPMSVLNVLLY